MKFASTDGNSLLWEDVVMSIEQPQAAQPLDDTGPFSDEVYRDRVNGWRRRFTLTGDRLIIQGKQFLGSESETIVRLRGIDTMYGTVRHRNSTASTGMVLVGGVFAIMGAAIYFEGASQVLRAPGSWPLEIVGGMALLYLIVGLKNIRRVELYKFNYMGGRFDIARNGPDRDRFDAFIARLIARVNALRTPPVPNQGKPDAAPPKDAAAG